MPLLSENSGSDLRLSGTDGFLPAGFIADVSSGGFQDVTLGALESRTIQLTAVPKKEVQQSAVLSRLVQMHR